MERFPIRAFTPEGLAPIHLLSAYKFFLKDFLLLQKTCFSLSLLLLYIIQTLLPGDKTKCHLILIQTRQGTWPVIILKFVTYSNKLTWP